MEPSAEWVFMYHLQTSIFSTDLFSGLLMAPTVAPASVEVHAPTGVEETKEPEV